MASVACALLVTAGLFFLFGIRPNDMTSVLARPFEGRRRLRQKVQVITGRKQNILHRQFTSAQQMLDASGMGGLMGSYQLLSVILAVLGLCFGLAIDNIPASVVLAGGLALVPLVIIYVKTGEYTRALNEKLESAIGMVGNGYIQSGDLISAVQGSLSLLPAPLNDVFNKFLVEATLIDANVVRALSNMRERIENRYWKDWCSVLIQCQTDRQLRFALPGITQRLGETRRVQMEVDTTIRRHFGDYILTVLIVLGSIPLMGSMMPEWYEMLMTTIPGKITFAVILFAVLSTSVWVARINRPVDTGGGRI